MKQSKLPFLPDRSEKPRTGGVTMVMDKGLSVRQAEDLAESAGPYIDYIKLGYGTSLLMDNVAKKISVYKKAKIRVYLGGTLFEAFIIRGMLKEYIRYMKKLKLDTVEVSDGSMKLDHKLKCKYIKELAGDFQVLSEVGAKESRVFIPPADWAEMMAKELKSGSSMVIGESRESGSTGIYSPSGKARVDLIKTIISNVDQDKVMWEAPMKSQQAWFIKEFGANVNLGNIPPIEVLPLETLRMGLRVDTFFQNLPEKFRKFQLK
jgi:phosphosulfolactate synthase